MLRGRVGAWAHRRASVLIACVLLAGGCVSPPTPAAVLATGFRSPEQTFETFKTALRGDLVDLEYRCLSGAFKAEHRVSLQTYHEARAQLLREEPLFKLAARAKIVERTGAPERGRVQLLVRVRAFFVTRTFLVNLVREGFYQSYDERGVIEGAPADWSSIASEGNGRLVVDVPMPEGFVADEIGELRAGRQWKIDGFESIALP